MIKLNKIKLILWDFDDTLCFHSDHRSPKDEFDTEYNVKVLDNGFQSATPVEIINYVNQSISS